MKTEIEKTNNEINNQKLQLIYLIGVFLLCIKFFLEKFTVFEFYDNVIAAVFCILFGIKLLFQKYTKKQLLLLIIGGLISIITAYITEEYVVLYTYLMIFSSQKIEIKRVIKLCLLTFSSLLLICSAVYMTRYFIGLEVPLNYRINGNVRFTFYMNHPNIYAGIVLWCSAMFIYLKNKSLKVFNFVLLFIINGVTFMLTDSRTSFIAFIFLVIAYFISSMKHIDESRLKVIAKYSFIIFLIMTIAISLSYGRASNNPVLLKINDLLSQRPYLSSYAFNKYGVSILPRDIDFTTKIPWLSGRIDELFIDSLYIRVTIKYGIIYLLYLTYISINMVNKRTGRKEISFILLFTVIGMLEKYISYPVIGFPILFFEDYLWRNYDE